MIRAISSPKATRVLQQSAVAASITGTLTETTLATVTIPGGTMGPNDSIRVTAVWSVTNNANAKTLKCKFGGTDISSTSATSVATMREERVVSNRNSQASQVSFFGTVGGLGSSGVAITTMTKDTTAAQTVTITATLGNVADTATLESYCVELIPA